jgi:TP901 family phage tail tape measure protein
MAAGDSALNLVLTITAVDSASSIINQIADGLKGMAGDGVLGAVVTGALGVATAVAGIGISAAKAEGDFQQSMETLVTSAGEAQDQIASLSQEVLKMSVDTGTSTQQLTQGMYYVESAGYHAADAIKVMTAAAEGAKAENASLDTVSKALTTTMTDYHMSADQATQAMNGLIAIVQNGKTNLEDLASSMGAVLPIASSMGISFSQVGGAMAELTNAGVPARQAAQNLAHVFVALQSPSKIAVSSMTDVGLSAQEVKNALVSQGLPEAFQLIEDHVGKKFPAGSVEYQTALKNILGGMVGLRTAAALTGDSLTTTEADIKKVADALNQGGDAVMGWDVVQGEFNFQLDRAQQAINALMITLGQKLLPLLSPIVAGFTNMIETITAWVSGLQSAGASGNIFINILTSLGISTNTAELIVADFSFTLHLLGEIIGNISSILTNVFGAAVHFAGNVLVGLANGPIQDIIKSFNEVLVFINDFTSWLNDTFTNLGIAAEAWGRNLGINFTNGFVSVIGGIIDAVISVITTIEDYLGFASPTRKGPGSKAHKWGPALVQTLADGMVANVSYLDDASATVAKHVGTGNDVPLQISTQTTGLSSGVSAIGGQLDAICSKHATAASKCASDTLTHGLANDLKSNAPALKSATDLVAKHLDAIPLHAATAAQKTKAALATALPEPAPTQAAVDSIGKILDQIPEKAKSAAQKTASAIKVIPEAARQMANALTEITTKIIDFLRPAFNYIVSTIQSQIVPAFRLFLASVHTLADSVRDFIQFAGPILVGAIVSAVTAIGKWIVQSGVLKTIWDAVILGVKTLIQLATQVVNAISNVVIAITRWITSGKAAKDIAPIWQAIGTTIQSNLSIFKQSIEGMIGAVQSAWSVVQSQLIPALVNLGNTLKPVGMFIVGLAVGILQAQAAFTKWVATSGIIKTVWVAIGDAMKVFISIVSQIINAISSALKPVFAQLAQTFETQVKPAWDHLITAIKPLLPFLGDVAKFIGGILLINLGVLVAALTGIIKAFGGLLEGIIKALGGVIQFVSGFIQFFIGMWSFFCDLITGKWDKLGQDLGTMWQGVIDMFQGLANFFYGIWEGLVKGVVGLVSGFVQGIIDFFTNLYNDLVGHSIVPDTVNGIMDWWKKIPAFIQNLLASLVKWIVNAWNTIKTDATTAWSAITKAVSDAVTKVGDWLKNWASGLITNFKTWGTNMVKGFGDAISAGIHWVTDAANNVATTVKNILGIQSPAKEGPLSTSDKWMPNLMNMFVQGINNGRPAVDAAMTGLSTDVTGKFSSLSSQTKISINDIEQALFGLSSNIQGQTTHIGTQMDGMKAVVSGAVLGAAQSVDSAATQIRGSAQSIGQDFVTVQTTAQTMQSVTTAALAQAANGAQSSGQTIVSSNNQVISSTKQTATAHTTLKTTITQNSQQMATQVDQDTNWMQQGFARARSLMSTVGNEISRDLTSLKNEIAFDSAWWGKTITSAWNGIVGAVGGFMNQIQGMGASAMAQAQSIAASIQALLGHSTPRIGPLKDDDQWGKHFVQNIVGGIEDGMPGLSSATKNVAATLAGVLPNNQIKISADSSLIGSLTDGSNKPMIIYQVLDGKVISKTVTNYQTRELRVQGVIRSV